MTSERSRSDRRSQSVPGIKEVKEVEQLIKPASDADSSTNHAYINPAYANIETQIKKNSDQITKLATINRGLRDDQMNMLKMSGNPNTILHNADVATHEASILLHENQPIEIPQTKIELGPANPRHPPRMILTKFEFDGDFNELLPLNPTTELLEEVIQDRTHIPVGQINIVHDNGIVRFKMMRTEVRPMKYGIQSNQEIHNTEYGIPSNQEAPDIDTERVLDADVSHFNFDNLGQELEASMGSSSHEINPVEGASVISSSIAINPVEHNDYEHGPRTEIDIWLDECDLTGQKHDYEEAEMDRLDNEAGVIVDDRPRTATENASRKRRLLRDQIATNVTKINDMQKQMDALRDNHTRLLNEYASPSGVF